MTSVLSFEPSIYLSSHLSIHLSIYPSIIFIHLLVTNIYHIYLYIQLFFYFNDFWYIPLSHEWVLKSILPKYETAKNRPSVPSKIPATGVSQTDRTYHNFSVNLRISYGQPTIIFFKKRSLKLYVSFHQLT